jgi:hypothetical protein
LTSYCGESGDRAKCRRSADWPRKHLARSFVIETERNRAGA